MSIIDTASLISAPMIEMQNQIDLLNGILSALRIKAQCNDYRRCRNIGLYDLVLSEGGRVRDIEKFTQEIGLGLRSKGLPIVRTALDEGVVRLQVIQDQPETVDFFERWAALERPKGVLSFYLGETLEDKPLWLDIHTAPHILIAGTSGSGKSTLLHSIIGNALMHDYVDLFLMDTKNIEFSHYGEMERCNVNVDTTYRECVDTLRKLVEIMDETYLMMRCEGLSSNYFATAECKHSFKLVVIDEFADLVMQDDDKIISDLVCRLAQKGRAAGIHIVLATQRPSVDVITGVIKANFPTRIACRVASRVDSNVILDNPSAAGLLGRGDALLKSAEHDLLRFQSAHTTAIKNQELSE